jgi:hypothetical protein
MRKYLQVLVTKEVDFKPVSETDYSMPRRESKVLMIPITDCIGTSLIANGWTVQEAKVIDYYVGIDISKGD